MTSVSPFLSEKVTYITAVLDYLSILRFMFLKEVQTVNLLTTGPPYHLFDKVMIFILFADTLISIFVNKITQVCHTHSCVGVFIGMVNLNHRI